MNLLKGTTKKGWLGVMIKKGNQKIEWKFLAFGEGERDGGGGSVIYACSGTAHNDNLPSFLPDNYHSLNVV